MCSQKPKLPPTRNFCMGTYSVFALFCFHFAQNYRPQTSKSKKLCSLALDSEYLTDTMGDKFKTNWHDFLHKRLINGRLLSRKLQSYYDGYDGVVAPKTSHYWSQQSNFFSLSLLSLLFLTVVPFTGSCAH